ncbi:MAG: hypothetical protein WCL32_07825 [Planctomycetota bacterium]
MTEKPLDAVKAPSKVTQQRMPDVPGSFSQFDKHLYLPNTLYAPEGFTPEKLAKILPNVKTQEIWKVIYILHAIEIQRNRNKRPKGAWSPLMAKILEAIIGRYKEVLDAMKKAQIIDCDEHYRVADRYSAGKSKYFRLNERYQHLTYRKTISLPDQCKKKFRKQRLSPVHKHLQYWLERLECADQAVDDMQLQMIRDKDFRLSVDIFGNRVHTNLTSLNSDYRKFLRVNGEELVAFDLRSSQLFFLLLLLFKYQKGLLVDSNKSTLINSLFSSSPLSHYDRPDPSEQPFEDAETQALFALIAQGRIFEYLMERTQEWEGSRSDFKQMFFQSTLFSKGVQGFKTSIAFDAKRIPNTFLKEFPSICKFINSFKEPDPTRLCSILQRHESGFIIHEVCEDLRVNFPEMPILTIHDCLITTLSKADRLERILNFHLGRLLIQRPSVKKEVWKDGRKEETPFFALALEKDAGLGRWNGSETVQDRSGSLEMTFGGFPVVKVGKARQKRD